MSKIFDASIIIRLPCSPGRVGVVHKGLITGPLPITLINQIMGANPDKVDSGKISRYTGKPILVNGLQSRQLTVFGKGKVAGISPGRSRWNVNKGSHGFFHDKAFKGCWAAIVVPLSDQAGQINIDIVLTISKVIRLFKIPIGVGKRLTGNPLEYSLGVCIMESDPGRLTTSKIGHQQAFFGRMNGCQMTATGNSYITGIFPGVASGHIFIEGIPVSNLHDIAAGNLLHDKTDRISAGVLGVVPMTCPALIDDTIVFVFKVVGLTIDPVSIGDRLSSDPFIEAFDVLVMQPDPGNLTMGQIFHYPGLGLRMDGDQMTAIQERVVACLSPGKIALNKLVGGAVTFNTNVVSGTYPNLLHDKPVKGRCTPSDITPLSSLININRDKILAAIIVGLQRRQRSALFPTKQGGIQKTAAVLLLPVLRVAGGVPVAPVIFFTCTPPIGFRITGTYPALPGSVGIPIHINKLFTINPFKNAFNI